MIHVIHAQSKTQAFSDMHKPTQLIVFFFGFVQTAEQFQYGDEIGEVADASVQYTMDDKGDLMSCHHQPSKLTPHTYAINNGSDLFCRSVMMSFFPV